MEWRRVKTMIIIVLLLANGFLLALVGRQKAQTLRYEQSALEQSIRVLAQNGIELPVQAISDRSGYPSMVMQRSIQAEQELACALFGREVTGNSRGGGLYIYSSDGYGQISMRSGGELSSELEDADIWRIDDPEAHAEALVKAMKPTFRQVMCSLEQGSGSVVYQQELKGTPLYSCRLTFRYRSGRLVSISGKVLAAEDTTQEAGELLSLPTVLMRFLGGLRDSGDVCSSIGRVSAGYQVVQSFADTVRLRPVWFISTNTADYYVDGMTGEVSRAEG